jgi:N-formylglutamate amidohydrolase
MPSSSAYASHGAVYRPTPGNQVDIVLGTRDGTTCDPVFVKEVRAFLQQLGYRVAVNNPYKGMEILRRHGDPARLRNSLQIEISKKLYLDESTNELATGFHSLKHDLSKMMIFMREFVEQSSQPMAAD